jgi:hypothetical protein
MFAEPTDNNELLQLVKNLNSSKSPGPDNTGPRLMKEVIAAIMDPLPYTCNSPISTGIVPEN